LAELRKNPEKIFIGKLHALGFPKQKFVSTVPSDADMGQTLSSVGGGLAESQSGAHLYGRDTQYNNL
jgi:hypothetical protein